MTCEKSSRRARDCALGCGLFGSTLILASIAIAIGAFAVDVRCVALTVEKQVTAEYHRRVPALRAMLAPGAQTTLEEDGT